MSDIPPDFTAARRKLVHNDHLDDRPARSPYSMLPDFGTTQANPTDTPCHARALHTHQRMVHEGIVLIKGGDKKYLRGTQEAIRNQQAVQQELGTSPVTLTPLAEEILAMETGDETGKGTN